MFGLGVGEIVVILFIALIFIGPKKLPELARGLGKGMREFQNAARGLGDNLRNPVDEVKKQVMDLPEESQARSSTGPMDQPEAPLEKPKAPLDQPEELQVKQDIEDHGEDFVSIEDINKETVSESARDENPTDKKQNS